MVIVVVMTDVVGDAVPSGGGVVTTASSSKVELGPGSAVSVTTVVTVNVCPPPRPDGTGTTWPNAFVTTALFLRSLSWTWL